MFRQSGRKKAALIGLTVGAMALAAPLASAQDDNNAPDNARNYGHDHQHHQHHHPHRPPHGPAPTGGGGTADQGFGSDPAVWALAAAGGVGALGGAWALRRRQANAQAD